MCTAADSTSNSGKGGRSRLRAASHALACYTMLHHAVDGCAHESSNSCRLQNGTTYNSYLIFGDKVALVDASHEKFRGLYMKALKAELKARGRVIDYIFVSHTEPDHSGMSAVCSPVAENPEPLCMWFPVVSGTPSWRAHARCDMTCMRHCSRRAHS